MGDRLITAFQARAGFDCQHEAGAGFGYFAAYHHSLGLSTLWIPERHADAIADLVEAYDGDAAALIVQCAMLIRERSDVHSHAQ